MTAKQTTKPGKKLAVKKQTIKDLPTKPGKAKGVKGGGTDKPASCYGCA